MRKELLMSYAFQNSSYNVNYNSPTIISPRFVVGLSTALLSAIIAAAMAIPLRAASPQAKKTQSNVTIESIIGMDEDKPSSRVPKSKKTYPNDNSRVEFVL
jgi:hypothetical protein